MKRGGVDVEWVDGELMRSKIELLGSGDLGEHFGGREIRESWEWEERRQAAKRQNRICSVGSAFWSADNLTLLRISGRSLEGLLFHFRQFFTNQLEVDTQPGAYVSERI